MCSTGALTVHAVGAVHLGKFTSTLAHENVTAAGNCLSLLFIYLYVQYFRPNVTILTNARKLFGNAVACVPCLAAWGVYVL